MKKILLLIIVNCLGFAAIAQNAPKWMDKSKKAVVSITTFDKDNRKINTTNGFFISEDGEVLSGYSIFKGAFKATVADSDGNTYPVVSVIGADDLYDVIRIKISVSKKIAFLPLATEPVAINTPAYLLPYSPGKAVSFKQGTVSEISKLKDPYSYYQLTFPLDDGQENSPLLLASGQVFGLSQDDASGKKGQSFAVSANYVKSLNITTTDAFNSVYTNIGIRKAWPSDIEQASISLFLMANSQDAQTYLETLNDFIATFPQAEDGYLSRASHYANFRTELASNPEEETSYLNLALADIQTAAKFSNNKGNVLYHQAKLIYGVATSDMTITDTNWSIGAAMAAINKAIETEDLPVYRQLEGDIYFYLDEYVSAYNSYIKVNDSDLASASSYYLTARALENIPGAQISDIIVLLDSTIAKLGTPTSPAAAPYILERIDFKIKLFLYDEALTDYDLYYSLVNGQVNDNFYFFREQAKFQKGDIDGALEDIKQAIELNSEIPDYYAEEAAIYVRLKKYNEALGSIEKALALATDFGACYRLRGICYVRLEKKTEACEAFSKAEELNDPLAKRLIRENCQ
ncbi:MAG: trypsin-like peptidase domain-containing protein [Tannerellaceae bacterium]|jgi:tetratricopeptide (TPR) repeat protein|nr:trypsin-like peptidase domain-containing protein [Tannerellaceae bacterium]